MKRVIEKVPVPLAGVTLGLTALGNLLAGLSPVLRWGCGTAAALLFFLLMLETDELKGFLAQMRKQFRIQEQKEAA